MKASTFSLSVVFQCELMYLGAPYFHLRRVLYLLQRYVMARRDNAGGLHASVGTITVTWKDGKEEERIKK